MTSDSSMTIRLFGAFRNLHSEPDLKIAIPENARTIGDLRGLLAAHFSSANAGFDAAGLLSKSAIANDREILLDTASFTNADRLALLPPVSGG